MKQLSYNDCLDSNIDDLDFNTENCIIYYKNTYSACHFLEQYKEDNLTIIGCDACACLLSTCFDLFDRGFQSVRILNDYIYTLFDVDYKAIYKENFGKWFKEQL